MVGSVASLCPVAMDVRVVHCYIARKKLCLGYAERQMIAYHEQWIVY